ncbi:MAG: Bug family tripartite tricarboxylate transporter substrate binding protein [Beijerinckiaceae bacterium]
MKIVLGALAVTLAFAASASADSEIERFYQGKRMQVIVGSGAGGGYDNYARQVARHLGRFIPGAPAFVVQNMPGAGGVVAANFVANVAPKDGTVIAATQREVPLIQLMGQQGPRFKASELQWLASLSSEPGVCAVATRTGVQTFEDMLKTPLSIGGTGPNITEFHPAMFNNLMGARFKLVKGYTTTQQVHLAIERGEADAICQSWASYKPQAEALSKQNLIRPIVQMSLRPDPEMSKLGMPLIFDRITPSSVSGGFTVDQVKAYFTLLIATGFAGRPFFVAQEVPKDRVAALRDAFAKMVVDAEFVAEAEKQKRDIDFVPGAELQQIMADLAKTPADVLSNLESLMQYKEAK